MNEQVGPWVRSRGLGRLLAQETNISDLLQELSDRDPEPWAAVVGFVPERVEREASRANHADLLLTARDGRACAIEVKLGHGMSAEQQTNYEALDASTQLFLVGLNADASRVADCAGRWTFRGLRDVMGQWTGSGDGLASLLSAEAADVLGGWDDAISSVLELPDAERAVVSALDQKFLVRVVTRHMASDLKKRGRLVFAGVTSGGGLPLVQGWTPVRDEGKDRAFIAEIRWWDGKPGGELRFGVDFDPRPNQVEDEEVRRAAYELARSMDGSIQFSALWGHLSQNWPKLAQLINRDEKSRPAARGDWTRVIANGFAGAPLEGGKRNNRRLTTPDFYGDGALRFQAIADVDFSLASGRDLVDLIDATLSYLSASQP